MAAMHKTSVTGDMRQHILCTAQRLIGSKGFSAVGLNELLNAAGVPKGSFYHYFGSKEAFGVALLEYYFERYWRLMDELFEHPDRSGRERLLDYWQHWLDSQSCTDGEGKCLAVKLGAEVSDLSEGMRSVLAQGTRGVIRRIADVLAQGQADGSLPVCGAPEMLAQTLYQLWLGASLLSKMSRDKAPLASAMAATRQLLQLDT